MDKLIKLFPFLPPEKDTSKLVLALLFYILAPTVAGFILGITIILAPLGLVCSVYMIMGIVFSIMSFTGHSVVPAEKASEEEEISE